MFTFSVVLAKTMVDLTEHEKRIFDIIKQNPDVVNSKEVRTEIADNIGMSEKTLRNRIGDLKRYGLLDGTDDKKSKPTSSGSKENSNELNQSTYIMVWAIASLASLAIFIIYF